MLIVVSSQIAETDWVKSMENFRTFLILSIVLNLVQTFGQTSANSKSSNFVLKLT